MTEDILERAIDNLRGEGWDNEADAVEELIAEIGRLRSEIMQPVETFGTPELVAWIEDLHRLVVDFPESERGQIPFVMTMGELLTRGLKSWTAAKDARIKELEAEAQAYHDRKEEALTLLSKQNRYVKSLEAAFLEACMSIEDGPSELEACAALEELRGHDKMTGLIFIPTRDLTHADAMREIKTYIKEVGNRKVYISELAEATHIDMDMISQILNEIRAGGKDD